MSRRMSSWCWSHQRSCPGDHNSGYCGHTCCIPAPWWWSPRPLSHPDSNNDNMATTGAKDAWGHSVRKSTRVMSQLLYRSWLNYENSKTLLLPNGCISVPLEPYIYTGFTKQPEFGCPFLINPWDLVPYKAVLFTQITHTSAKLRTFGN